MIPKIRTFIKKGETHLHNRQTQQSPPEPRSRLSISDRGGDLTFPDLECQLLLLTLDEGYLQPPPLLTLGVELLLSAASPDLGRVVAPLGHRPHLQRVVAPLGHYP